MARERGIRRTGSGWQVYVRVRGEFRSKHYPPDAAVIDMRRWREEQKARAVLNLPAETPSGDTFTRDKDEYLALVTGMVSYHGRAYHMTHWAEWFGAIPRTAITPKEIRRALETWRVKRKLSHATLNLYRTGLMHFFTVMDGKSGKNPVRDVPRYHEQPPRWQLPTWEQAREAVKLVSSEPARLRLTVMRLSGLPPAQIKRLTPADIHSSQPQVRIEGRRKGRGTSDVILPVLPKCHEALLALVKGGYLKSFFNSEVHRQLRKGCDRAKVPYFRVYDLRHRFLTTAALAIRDDSVIQALALHHSRSITARYIEQSVDPRLREGLKALRAYLKKHHKGE